MRIGSALALLAVGLILATAVDADVPGLDLQTLGNIIALVGILGLVVTLGLEYATHRSRRPPRPAQLSRERTAPPRRPEPEFDPIVRRPRRPAPDPAEQPTRIDPRR